HCRAMRSPKLLLSILAILAAPASASASFGHVVSAGESLSSVAATDGLSVAQLAAANGVSPDSQLIAGSTLQIPPQDSSADTSSATADSTRVLSESGAASAPSSSDTTSGDSGATASTAGSGYNVRPGDTLSA